MKNAVRRHAVLVLSVNAGRDPVHFFHIHMLGRQSRGGNPMWGKEKAKRRIKLHFLRSSRGSSMSMTNRGRLWPLSPLSDFHMNYHLVDFISSPLHARNDLDQLLSTLTRFIAPAT